MSKIRISLLGSLHVTHNGEAISFNRRKSIALMTYLVITRLPQSRDLIASLLWPEFDQSRAKAALRTTISDLKNSPIGNCLIIDRDSIALDETCDLWVDVHQFQDLLEVFDADDIDEDDMLEKQVQLESAVNLYRAEFLAGFTLKDSPTFDEWQSYQTEQLHRGFIRLLDELITANTSQNEYEDAIRHAQRLLSFEPFNESVHFQLIQLYYQSGERIAALRQYEEFARLLDDEMGISPHSQITQFYEKIKNEHGSLYDVNRDIDSSSNNSILPALPNLTIGRQQDLESIRNRIINRADNESNIAVVQGWPGVGKSTFVSMVAHDSSIASHFAGGIYWTSLGEEVNPLAKLKVWGQTIGAVDVEQSNSIEEAMNILIAHFSDKQALLIIDDVWQLEEGIPFKIGGTQCFMIFTTRFNDIANSLATTPDDIIKLSILDTSKSLELLRTLAPRVVQDHPEETLELVQDLEGLPLALQVAGRLLHAEAKMGWGVTDLLDDLRSGASLLEAQAPADRIDINMGTTPTLSVLLQKSTDRLDLELQERFALLGVFAPKPATFDMEAMAAVWETNNARDTARVLVDRGLLEPIGNGRFQMHALLAMHARSLFAD